MRQSYVEDPHEPSSFSPLPLEEVTAPGFEWEKTEEGQAKRGNR